MADSMYVPSGLIVQGNLTVGGNMPDTPRTSLTQDTLQEYMIPWSEWQVWNAVATRLPGTSANDDLGLYGNTFATGSPAIESYDLAAVSTTLYARAQFCLPPEYDAGQTVTFRAKAGMVTTVADTSCTLDLQCYESDKSAGIGSDLCTTDAININGDLTLSNCDYTITPAGLQAGDVLDMRIAVAVVDGATATVVKARIGYTAMLLDIRG